MTTNEIINGERVSRIRELNAENSALRKEVSVLKEELTSLRASIDLALCAIDDFKKLPAGGRLVLIDGYNLLFTFFRNEKKNDCSVAARDVLVSRVKRYLELHPSDFAWIVFDGPRLSVESVDRLRISFTGGSGEQRADNLIVRYLRGCRYLGISIERIAVATKDSALSGKVAKSGASVMEPSLICSSVSQIENTP